ncbi:MAG: hypothetical protein FJ320_05880 [SAR202 cluster bacterium]|nr:hypothetical protein [SAR202 cluster bacterium]
MVFHQSSVNYQNLIRDLAEMYPIEVPEVVVIELIANSLDAKATRISVEYNAQQKVLVITDDGHGMTANQFGEYHDFAAGLKSRGTGIGFAGVGAKISFNVADRVITETRGDSFSGGSDWYLESAKKLVWKEIQPSRLRLNGTRVEVQFRKDVQPPYDSTEDLVNLIARNYLPLLDTKFLQLYGALKLYPGGLRFVVNGQEIAPSDIANTYRLDKVHRFYPEKSRKRYGHGIFGIGLSDYPIGAGICGVLLCTRGKVVKADFLGQFPGALGTRILGIVEVPPFVDYLTTAKTDFIRSRGKLKEFESFYDPIRQEFKAWLKDVGVEQPEVAAPDEAAKLERELRKIIDEVPELSEFFGFRVRREVPHSDENGSMKAETHEGIQHTFPMGEGEKGDNPGPLDIGEDPGQTLEEAKDTGTQKATPIGRTSKRGPKIAFASAPERIDLAWADGNTVMINTGHPGYEKSRSNPSARNLHNIFSIAGAVQKVLVSPDGKVDAVFVDRMIAAWGRK